jgi:hypothetical protein
MSGVRDHKAFLIKFTFTQEVREWVSHDESRRVGYNKDTQGKALVIAPEEALALAWIQSGTRVYKWPDLKILEVQPLSIDAFIEEHIW